MRKIKISHSLVTSSKNMTAGCFFRATANKPRINFSPSPKYLNNNNRNNISNHLNPKPQRVTYLDVTDEAVMLKNANPDSVATAFASIVFPVPGGPNNNTPFGGSRNPVNKSGRRFGRITASCRVCCTIHSLFHHKASQYMYMCALPWQILIRRYPPT